MSIVKEGVATQDDVDTIVRSTFGFRLPFLGPFAIADMAGLDVYALGSKTFEEAFGPRLVPRTADGRRRGRPIRHQKRRGADAQLHAGVRASLGHLPQRGV